MTTLPVASHGVRDVFSEVGLGEPAASEASINEQFLDLLLHDKELLDAEFVDLLVASWPGSVVPPPSEAFAAPRWRPGRHEHRRVRLAWRPHGPGHGSWACQRSPPHRMTAGA